MIILKGEKCESLYKLKEENSVRVGVSMISLEESSSQGGALRNTATGRERVKVLQEGGRVYSSEARDGPSPWR